MIFFWINVILIIVYGIEFLKILFIKVDLNCFCNVIWCEKKIGRYVFFGFFLFFEYFIIWKCIILLECC